MHKGEGDARFERLLRALGYGVLTIQKASGDRGDGGVLLNEIRFKLDADNRTSVLVILKGTMGADKVIGFTGAPNLETAVLAVKQKLEGGAVRWREDLPYGS